MKCKNCNKEAEYRYDFQWFCWKHYLVEIANQKSKELKINEQDKLKR